MERAAQEVHLLTFPVVLLHEINAILLTLFIPQATEEMVKLQRQVCRNVLPKMRPTHSSRVAVQRADDAP
jgi:hypothetical protein